MGRPAKLWKRSATGTWHSKIGGTMHDFGKDEQAAREAFEKLLAQLSGGGPALPAPAVKAGTVADLVPRYVRQLDVTPKTRVDYADRLKWLATRFGTLTVPTLDAATVETELRGTGWKANTRRQTGDVITSFVRWCGRTEFRIRKPPVETRGDEYLLTPEEAAKLLEHAEGDFGPYLRTLWLTGCRPGEARAMTAENVYWAVGKCVLREHKTARKTGRPRQIPLSDDALAVLAAQRDRYGRGHLFRSDGVNAFRMWEVCRLMRQLRERCGLRPEVILYGTRHTFATTLVKKGHSTARVAAILGHTSSALVERNYAHLLSDMQGLRQVAADAAGAG